MQVKTDGEMETRLFMRRARASSFRSYRLFAENEVGTTTSETQLLQRMTVAALPSYQFFSGSIIVIIVIIVQCLCSAHIKY